MSQGLRGAFGERKSSTQAAYNAFITGFFDKGTYYIRTKEASTQLRRVDKVFQIEFIPSLEELTATKRRENYSTSLPNQVG